MAFAEKASPSRGLYVAESGSSVGPRSGKTCVEKGKEGEEVRSLQGKDVVFIGQ